MTTPRLLLLAPPLGPLRALATAEGIVRVDFAAAAGPEPAGEADQGSAPASPPTVVGGPVDDEALAAAHLDRLEAELRAYLAGGLTQFTVPLRPVGTPFQLRVWAALAGLPYGGTCSYAALCAALGLPPGAARAVGQANGQNPIAILIPCHRVVQRGGGLGGYGGGLERKAWLLAHERRHAPVEGPAADPAEQWSGQLRLGW